MIPHVCVCFFRTEYRAGDFMQRKAAPLVCLKRSVWSNPQHHSIKWSRTNTHPVGTHVPSSLKINIASLGHSPVEKSDWTRLWSHGILIKTTFELGVITGVITVKFEFEPLGRKDLEKFIQSLPSCHFAYICKHERPSLRWRGNVHLAIRHLV